MFSTLINSPQTSHPLSESLNIDFNERINSLNTSLLNQLEILPETTSSLEQIFHLISIIFRFLRKNLRSQQSLSNKYNNLSNTIQKIISICAQYLHDRRDHENELLFLKDKISQLIGQIGYTQLSLEQHWTIVYSLENEIERLQILLHNPQVLQINQQKFQVLQEAQKNKLDRLIKENDKIKVLIHKQKESIQTIQTQIESDVKELQILKPILNKIKLEQKDLHNTSAQIEKQNSDLQIIVEKTRNMEIEYTDRMKTTKAQYSLLQNQLNTLTDTYKKTNRKRISVQTNETNIKQEIENVKNQITKEQTRTLIRRDQIRNLRHETHELEQAKRSTQRILKSEEHTNFTLERKRLMLEHTQQKLRDRFNNLTEQLNNIFKQNQTKKHTISINMIHLEDQQYKITTMTIAWKKIIHLNNNFEQILQENRLIRSNEQEKLRSMKQILSQKRKQLITHTKRLRSLSINEHRLINNTIRNTSEIIRLNTIFHESNNTEKYSQSILRQKKTEFMKREKQRALLNRYLHDNNNNIDFLTKKNQLIENELENKIDQFHSLNSKFLKQNHHRILLSNQKQYYIYSYRQKLKNLDKLHQKNTQLEKLSNNEIDHIINKNEENQQLKLNIHHLQQQIVNMITRNKRQIDECSLLTERNRLYTHLNDTNHQQQQRCSFHLNHFSRRITNLQEENNRLTTNLHTLQNKAMITISSHRDKVVKKDTMYQMNQILSHRPITIRNNPPRGILEDYSTYVKRLMKIIHQCVEWREKLAWIYQLYFTKIEQIHQQTRSLSTKNEMILRHKINSEVKQCKARRAESRLQIL